MLKQIWKCLGDLALDECWTGWSLRAFKDLRIRDIWHQQWDDWWLTTPFDFSKLSSCNLCLVCSSILMEAVFVFNWKQISLLSEPTLVYCSVPKKKKKRVLGKRSKPNEYLWSTWGMEDLKKRMDGCHKEAGLSKSFGSSDVCLLKVAQLRAAMTGAREGLGIVWEARSCLFQVSSNQRIYFF